MSYKVKIAVFAYSFKTIFFKKYIQTR